MVPRPIRQPTKPSNERQDPTAHEMPVERPDRDDLHVAPSVAEGQPTDIKAARDVVRLVIQKHRDFHRFILDECCARSANASYPKRRLTIPARRRGLLVVLDKEHPLGDFAFCDLRWSQEEVETWKNSGTPPQTLDDLPADMPMVTLYYFAATADYTSNGPNMTAPQFRRLNGCRENRLIVWDIWAWSQSDPCHPLIVVPSEDVGMTDPQRSSYRRALKVNKKKERTKTLPRLEYILRNGRQSFDYLLGPRGPQVYDGWPGYHHIWLLCWRLTQSALVEHPIGYIRDAASYLHPLWRIHQRLVLEQIRN